MSTASKNIGHFERNEQGNWIYKWHGQTLGAISSIHDFQSYYPFSTSAHSYSAAELKRIAEFLDELTTAR